MGAPPAAMFAGGYVAAQFGGGRPVVIGTAAALTAGVVGMNLLGVRVSGRVQLACTAVLAVLLAAATVVALPHADAANLTPFAPHGWWAVGRAAAVLVWAFAGWEALTSLSGEYRRPVRDIPRATGAAIVVIGVLYLGIAAATVLVLGQRAAATSAPLSDLLATGLGEPARPITMAVAVLLTVGTMNAYFAGGAKLGAAMGRDGALPAWFARGSQAGDVPRRALLVLAGLSGGSLLVTAQLDLGLRPAVLAVTGSFALVYLLGCAAAVRLLPRGSWAWRGALVSLAAVVALLWLTGWHLLWGLAIAAAAATYQLARARATR
jgi:amino acid efflux transporter